MSSARAASDIKLAVSNIAWPRALDDEAFACLTRSGIRSIEVAPTRVWPDWDGASLEAARSQRDEWLAQGMSVSSLQAVLFSRPGALLFGDEAAHEHLVLHLEYCAQLAAAFSAGPVVFGAPRNRLKGHLPDEEAFLRAARTLRRIAPAFTSHGATLCIEANPPAYGCDFVMKASEAATLVRMVDHPGVRLHLDTACMYLAGDALDESIYTYSDILAHFHVSEPQLGDFSAPVVPHEDAAEALSRIGYQGWITLEMRATTTPIASLFSAAVYLADVYQEAVTHAC